MPLEPTEREEHFFKAMVDAADGSTPEELEPTERKEHWYQEIIDAIKTGGGGSGGGVLVVHSVDGTLDKTWQEIHDSDFVVLKYPDGSIQVTTGAGEDDGEYLVGFFTYGVSPTTYVAQTASGYPSMEEGH